MLSAKITEKVAAAVESIGGRQVSDAAKKLFLSALDPYGDEAVSKALDRCIRECKSWLSPSDIISRIDDGRPGADEAWGLIPKSEADSVVWTDEMAEAFSVCSDLIEQGDLVAARRSFIDAYEKRVQAAHERLCPVHWTPSLGIDKAGRERVLRNAAETGKLPVSQVKKIMPGALIPPSIEQLPEKPEGARPQLISSQQLRKSLEAISGYKEMRAKMEQNNGDGRSTDRDAEEEDIHDEARNEGAERERTTVASTHSGQRGRTGAIAGDAR